MEVVGEVKAKIVGFVHSLIREKKDRSLTCGQRQKQLCCKEGRRRAGPERCEAHAKFRLDLSFSWFCSGFASSDLCFFCACSCPVHQCLSCVFHWGTLTQIVLLAFGGKHLWASITRRDQTQTDLFLLCLFLSGASVSFLCLSCEIGPKPFWFKL